MATRAKLQTVGEVLDYEAWRPALAAFYRAGAWSQSAEYVERGYPLSVDDERHIRCLQAALPLVLRHKLKIAA